MGYRVGVDIGGTFADFCAFDEDSGAIATVKVLSTPATPGQEVIEGLNQLRTRFGIAPGDITWFTHGTTVGINSIIQRKGIRLALFTTENFVDVLELARLKQPDPYHLMSRRPEPLVTRDRVMGIAERILADGRVDTPLRRESVEAAVARARAMGCEGIVLAFLHSYRNPAHEIDCAAMIGEIAPELEVYASHRIRPIIREYERTSTAVLHSYVQAPVAAYLTSLEAALAEIGVGARAMITKSNGGVMTAELGKTQCIDMLLSGTAAGVMGAAYVAREAGLPRVLSLDIGGTSADVAIIMGGEPGFGSAEVVGDFPVYVPTVSVTSIGEGGGSVASLDDMGLLAVGPESAGSTPGPACYGRGGERATITDAFAVLGYIGHGKLGYDMVGIDRKAARLAVGALAGPLRRSVEEAAEGIIEIAVSGMYREVSKLASRQGIDIADFALLAFGGAGPMMACLLARELAISTVVVPRTPGVLSALGGLTSDAKNDFVATAYVLLSREAMPEIRATVDALAADALAWIREQGFLAAAELRPSAEMRYRGQSFEIEIALKDEWVTSGDVAAIAAAFHAEHRRLYGHADEAAPIQIIQLNMVVLGATPKPRLAPPPAATGEAVPSGTVEVYLDGALRSVPLYRRDALAPGHTFESPAIVAQDDTTTCVPPGFSVAVDPHGNLVIARKG
ncbi:hydantoinase [Acuticoccus sediminis]|uniref:Hydantoinase n=1 Tax=Acuticoccus sediminis TaxID=2184697 RepID=A0A8B2NST6_9HYPH|nr:hydantoinase/oxoprolinase family protein [Acuticoccus sediminis]RAI00172.1 hydantoinase [Acuticoccus sediminis]